MGLPGIEAGAPGHLKAVQRGTDRPAGACCRGVSTDFDTAAGLSKVATSSATEADGGRVAGCVQHSCRHLVQKRIS